MNPPAFEFEGTIFRTKTDLLRAIREVLHASPYKATVASRLSPEHERFVYALLTTKHPCWVEIVGPGIAELWVRNDNKGGTSGFHALRVDGVWRAFSIRHFTQENHRSAAHDAKSAFRDEVYRQRLELKDAWFSSRSRVFIDIGRVQSVVTPGAVVLADACEIDHFSPTFSELLQAFLGHYGKTLDQIETGRTEGREGNRDFALADPILSTSWREWHRFYCFMPAHLWLFRGSETLSGLRVVSVEEHRQITSAQQRKRT